MKIEGQHSWPNAFILVGAAMAKAICYIGVTAVIAQAITGEIW